MSVEEYPDEERPYVGVGIPYASTAPQEIERNVTRPIEEILSTIGGIDRMFSNTRTGRVWVGISLEEGQNMTAKAIEAKELIESIRHRLPDDIRHIQLRGQDDGDEPILSFVISAPNLDEQDAWRLLDARVRMVLERVPGVNSVQLFGADQLYVRIALDPSRLEAHGLDVLDVQRRLADENFYLSAGSIEQARLETQVRPLGRFTDLQDILDLPVRAGLTLADIAEVSYVPQEEADQHRLNGEDALGVSVYKKPEANLVAVAADVQAAMEQAAKDPELLDAAFLTVSNQAESVIEALRNLIQNGVIGGILSALVLLAFIRRLTPSLLITATVPLALIATLSVMYFGGLTLNVLSLVGLMLAVGLLVDNSVVVSESIALKRREHGLSPYQAADRGVTEVGMAITAGTLTTIVVFVPTLFLDTVETSTAMRNVALPLCTSIAASLVIATTLIPALLARLPEGQREPRHRVFERLADVYQRVVLFTLRHRYSALVVALVLAGVGYYAYTRLDVNMAPQEDSESLQLRFWVRGTMTLERMEAIVDDVEAAIMGNRDELGIGDVSTEFDYDRGDVFMTMREDGKYAASVVQETHSRDDAGGAERQFLLPVEKTRTFLPRRRRRYGRAATGRFHRAARGDCRKRDRDPEALALPRQCAYGIRIRPLGPRGGPKARAGGPTRSDRAEPGPQRLGGPRRRPTAPWPGPGRLGGCGTPRNRGSRGHHHRGSAPPADLPGRRRHGGA